MSNMRDFSKVSDHELIMMALSILLWHKNEGEFSAELAKRANAQWRGAGERHE